MGPKFYLWGNCHNLDFDRNFAGILMSMLLFRPPLICSICSKAIRTEQGMWRHQVKRHACMAPWNRYRDCNLSVEDYALYYSRLRVGVEFNWRWVYAGVAISRNRLLLLLLPFMCITVQLPSQRQYDRILGKSAMEQE